MFLSAEEMKTHLYQENVDVISRGDTAIMQAAIDAAQAESRGYLGAYDMDAVFAKEGNTRNALLLIFIKDIATWHFLVLCNAGHELSLRQDRYDRAISWLKAVQRGEVTPDLPVKEKGTEASGTGMIRFGSNPKKGQHY